MPFSLYSVGILQFYTQSTFYRLCFQVLTTTDFLCGFSNLSLIVFVLTTSKTKIFIFKYFQHLFSTIPSQSTLLSQEVFCDYQINSGNTTNLNKAFKGGEGGGEIFNISGKGGGEPYMRGLCILLGDLITTQNP